MKLLYTCAALVCVTTLFWWLGGFDNPIAEPRNSSDLTYLPQPPLTEPAAPREDLTAAVRTTGENANAATELPRATVSAAKEISKDLVLPTSDIELQLSQSGLLRLEAIDPSGVIIEKPLQLEVRLRDPALESGRSLAMIPVDCSALISPSNQRVRVPLAVPLFLHIRDDANGYAPLQQMVIGPLKPDEEVLVRVQMEALPFLTGRMLDADRKPLRQRFLRILMHWASGSRSGDLIQTDSQGRFRIAIRAEWAATQLRLLELAPISPREPQIDSQSLEFQTKATAKEIFVPAAGAFDLGDLVVRPSEHYVLATGKVLDESEKPLANVKIEAVSADLTNPTVLDARTISDRNGLFVVPSKNTVPSLVLRASLEGYVRTDLPVRSGTEDVEITLVRGGTIAGSVLLPDHFHPALLSISLYPPNGSGSAWHRVDPDGKFRITGCKPGSYSLAFSTMGWEPVLEVRDVEIRGANTTHDPRLQAVDLRNLFTVIRVLALLDSGEPIRHGAFVLSNPAMAGRTFPLQSDHRGFLTIPIPTSMRTVRISMRGGTSHELNYSPEIQELRFAEGLSLVLTTMRPTLPTFFSLYPELVLLSDSSITSALSKGDDDTPGVLKFRLKVPRSGRYAVRWTLRKAYHSAALGSPGTPEWIEVRERLPDQTFTVTPSAEALAAAIRELGG